MIGISSCSKSRRFRFGQVLMASILTHERLARIAPGKSASLQEFVAFPLTLLIMDVRKADFSDGWKLIPSRSVNRRAFIDTYPRTRFKLWQWRRPPASRLCMRACDEPVVKLNRLICNCGPGKRLFDALAPCFSELSGLFGICHEI